VRAMNSGRLGICRSSIASTSLRMDTCASASLPGTVSEIIAPQLLSQTQKQRPVWVMLLCFRRPIDTRCNGQTCEVGYDSRKMTDARENDKAQPFRLTDTLASLKSVHYHQVAIDVTTRGQRLFQALSGATLDIPTMGLSGSGAGRRQTAKPIVNRSCVTRGGRMRKPNSPLGGPAGRAQRYGRQMRMPVF